MENVPQVVCSDFTKWQLKLESLGYKNYVEILNSKNYGIPQNRKRCFMISILGDYSYDFPMKLKLKYKLKDMLEHDVPDKYYLSERMISFFIKNTQHFKQQGGGFAFKPIDPLKQERVARTITTKAGSRMDDNYIIDEEMNGGGN